MDKKEREFLYRLADKGIHICRVCDGNMKWENGDETTDTLICTRCGREESIDEYYMDDEELYEHQYKLPPRSEWFKDADEED